MDFTELAARYGLPLAMALCAIWAMVTERIVPGARVTKHEQECKDRIAEMAKDRDYYRQIAFEALKHTERLAGGVERAIAGEEGNPS